MFIPIVREERIPAQAATEPDDFAREHPVLDSGGRTADALTDADPRLAAMPWSRGGR